MRSSRLLACCVLVVCAASQAGVDQTVHNLGTTGPGTVKALSEERICIFCHAPHRATTRAPLWNREDSRATYLPYDTSTLDATPGQPTGASRMCLSCHDGTVALGALVSEPAEIPFPAGHTTLDPSTGSLETDLADDHPVSFVYDQALATTDGELLSPSAITPPVTLDASSQLQCTSCHDPHDNTNGQFLVATDSNGALCLSCHDRTDWSLSSHSTSAATWNGSGADPWPGSSDRTVASNACRNCHQPHTAPQPDWIVKQVEEQACLVCHNGNVAAANIEADINKAHRHPLDLAAGTHDPAEDPVTAPRHVECTDCHNPHQARQQTANAPFAAGSLAGVRGIDVDGNPVDPVQFQYEVCFSCHGDGTSATQAIPRTAGDINTRLEFGTDAISYHSVTQPGTNPDVPTLISPWTETSRMYCTDCHGSDTADSSGIEGPHGSTNAFILRRNYTTADYTQESQTAYALCYGCHSRTALLTKDQSGFKEHRKHIQGEDSPCSACHDPHGVAASNGTPGGNTHLISFDTSIVRPNRNGELRFEDRGNHRGACYLDCHGKDHRPETYP